jgi:hypothetical protein
MRKMLLVSVLGLSAAAAGVFGQTPPAPTIWIASQSLPITSSLQPSYSAAHVQDVVFVAILTGQTPGEHKLNLKVYTPRGYLYQTLGVPFTVPTPPAAQPLPLLPIVLSARLPVAATPIVESSLYGAWRAVPYIDEAAEPVGDAYSFEINR